MKIIPVIRPGRVTREKAKIDEMTTLENKKKNPVKAHALLNSVKRQARKMRRNLMERRPPSSPSSGRILQTPTLRALAIPSPAVMNEVSKVN